MGDTDTEAEEISREILNFESWLEVAGARTEVMMDILELLTALLMIFLFGLGVYDLGYKVYELIQNGTYTDPNQVLKVIDTALLLLIIVELYRTVVAYIEDLNILPIVLNVALIAMARKVISFRTTKYATKGAAVQVALAYGFLLMILVVAFYLVHRIQSETEFNIYAAGEDSETPESG